MRLFLAYFSVTVVANAFTIRRTKRSIPTSPVSYKATEAVTTNDRQTFVPWVDGESREDLPTEDLERYVRNEYHKWLLRYEKQSSAHGYLNFKQNFLTQLNSDREHGGHQFFHLNEFGDLSPEQYQTEVSFIEAYDKWSTHFKREHSRRRFQIFRANLQKQGPDKEQWDLTEFADLTQTEFLQLVTHSTFLEHKYNMWLKEHGKLTGNFACWRSQFLEQLETLEDHARYPLQKLEKSADLTPQDIEKETALKGEYQKWCETHGKSDDKFERYSVWKQNQADWKKQASPDRKLNKFADLEPEQFLKVASEDTFIKEEYHAWMAHYGKTSANFDVWKGNYHLQLSKIEHAFGKFVFDEYSDLTHESYQKELTHQFEYKKWCSQYGKIATKSRYQIFKQHRALTDEWMNLNEHADLTREQFLEEATVNAAQEFQDWLDFYDKKSGNSKTFRVNLEQLLSTLDYYKEGLVFDEYFDLTEDEKVAERDLQAQYKEWATVNHKSISNKRYQVYKENYARSLDLGLELNEDADLTEDQFVDMVTSHDFVQKQYTDWLAHYNKTSGNHEVFHENYFLQLEELKGQHCFNPFVFDEHSDLTDEERVWEPIYYAEYGRWCLTYGKPVDYSNAYLVWRRNCGPHVQAAKTKNTILVLTDVADQTKQEYIREQVKTVSQRYGAWLQRQDGTKVDGYSMEDFQNAFLLDLYELDHPIQPLDSSNLSIDSSDIQKQVDRICEFEYKQWCQVHGKEQDEHRYAMFRHNFVEQLQNITQGKLQLGQFADSLTKESLETNKLYQAHYEKWCKLFNQTSSEKRLEVFKINFLQLLKHNVFEGTNFVLNEFGASTEDEYMAAMSSEKTVREEYNTWVATYNKTSGAAHFDTYKKNYVKQLQSNLDAGVVLFHQGESALSSEDMDPFYRRKYQAWAKEFNKTTSEDHFGQFSRNLVQQLEYNLKHDACFSLNEFGDLTLKEWQASSKTDSNAKTSKNQPYFISNPVHQDLLSFSFVFSP